MATVDMDVQQLLIGGRWVGASSDRTFEKANPFTGEPAGSAAAASREDARAAVEARRDAALERQRA
jgi:acyl-CoA reductase-like NAD-dependent aldehyde dehydrogenase